MGQEEDSEDPGQGQRQPPFPPIQDDVCVMTSCPLHCYFSQHHGQLGTLTIWVASHKRKKRNP